MEKSKSFEIYKKEILKKNPTIDELIELIYFYKTELETTENICKALESFAEKCPYCQERIKKYWENLPKKNLPSTSWD